SVHPVHAPAFGHVLGRGTGMRTIARYSLLLGLATGPCIIASAQGPLFGLKAGVNMSNLHVDDADNENSRIGFNAGFFGRTNPDDPIGLQAEILYSTKGSHNTYHGFFGLVDQDVDFNLNYLEVPLMLSFRLAPVIEIQAGGYAAYLLSAKVSTSGD